MKSAYERAMERLEQESGPIKRLSDAQRDAIAEIDKQFDAKVAEQRLHYEGRIAGAAPEERLALMEEMSTTIAGLESKREKDKEEIWAQ